MKTFITFGVGIGNLGYSKRPRVSMRDWVDLFNQQMMPKACIVGWYGHTGNFVIRSTLTRRALSQRLAQLLGTPCAILSFRELDSVVQRLASITSHPGSADIRWTPGGAFLVRGRSRAGQPVSTAIATYRRLRHHVVCAQKNDKLTARGILDRDQRGGGWGGVAADIQRQLGGVWTARSARTLVGIFRRAAAAHR